MCAFGNNIRPLRLAKVSVVLIETVIHRSRKCLDLGRVMYGLKTSLKVIYFLGCLYWKLCHGYFCYIILHSYKIEFKTLELNL